MKAATGLVLLAMLTAAGPPALQAQECIYGPNSKSDFANASARDVVSTGSRRPGDGTLGFHYEFRDISMLEIQLKVHPSSYPVIGCVIPGTPAARAGLQSEDVILSVNGKDPRKPETLADRHVLGALFVIRIRRGEEEREVRLRVAPYPEASEQ